MEMTSTRNKRIVSMDVLKCFAIVCVLLGHATEQTSADIFWDHPLWATIYTFHMPLFMFLCGYFFHSSLRGTFGQMLVKKMRQLGVPSITAFALMTAIMLLTDNHAIADLCELSWMGFINAVWFLKCLLLCYIIIFPICRLSKSELWASIIASVAINLIPETDILNINFMLPMFCLGMVCNPKACGLNDWLTAHRRLAIGMSATFFLLMLPFWSGRLTVYMEPTQIINWNTMEVDWYNLGITIYRLAIGMAGTLMFYLLAEPFCRWLGKQKKGAWWTDLFCRIGGATLGIYILQSFLLEICIRMMNVYIPLPWSYLTSPIIALIELAACFTLVIVLRRNSILKFLLLGEK